MSRAAGCFEWVPGVPGPSQCPALPPCTLSQAADSTETPTVSLQAQLVPTGSAQSRLFVLHPHPSSAADGPFVMNHELEIQQAFSDYHSGQLQRKDDNPWKDDEEL